MATLLEDLNKQLLKDVEVVFKEHKEMKIAIMSLRDKIVKKGNKSALIDFDKHFNIQKENG